MFKCDCEETLDKEGNLSVSVYEVDFGKVNQYQRSTVKFVTFTNLSSEYPTYLRSINILGEFISRTSLPMVIPASKSWTAQIVYEPMSIGQANGSLKLVTRGNNEISVTFYGEGINPNVSSGSGEPGEGPGTSTELKYIEEFETETAVGIQPKSNVTDRTLIMQPKGNGAVQFSRTGNIRGNHANDLQHKNTDPNAVASGLYSVILGGSENQATDEYALVISGYKNRAKALGATILNGNNNTIEFSRNLIGCGVNNSITDGEYNVIVVGSGTTVKGSGNFLGSGTQNTFDGNTLSVVNGDNNEIVGTRISANIGNSCNITGSNVYIGIADSSTLNWSNSCGGFISNSTIASSDDLFVGMVESATVQNTNQGCIVSVKGINLQDVVSSFVGTGDNQSITESAYASIINGNNNSVSTDYSFIGSGQSNDIDSSISITGNSDYDASVIVSGSLQQISSTAYGFIGTGENNSILGSKGSVIMSGVDNTISYHTDQNFDTPYCFIATGDGNEIIGSPSSSILTGTGNTIKRGGDNTVLAGGSNNVTDCSVSVVSGFDINASGSDYIKLFGQYFKVNDAKYSNIENGFRNTLTTEYASVSGEYAHDIGYHHSVTHAMKDGTNWIRRIVDDNTGLATDTIAPSDRDLERWTNNNPLYQKGEILLQKMADDSRGTYDGSTNIKQYLYTFSKRYKEGEQYLDLPDRTNGMQSLFIPDDCVVFYEIESHFASIKNRQAIAIQSKCGIIMNTEDGLIVVKEHEDTAIGSEALNNCKIVLERDSLNRMVRFLVPEALKDFTGGAVLRYTLATQDAMNFYWNEL